jgi:hypothetical protein
LIESLAESEVCESGRKRVHRLVEKHAVFEREVGERVREILHFLIEFMSKSDMGERRREGIYRLVESI